MHEERGSVKQINRVKPLTAFKCEQAIRVLDERIAAIPDVKRWAEEAGVSREWLCKSLKTVYDKPPKVIIREVKYEKVVRLIQEVGIEAGCYSVAVDAGFRNATALSKFLSSFYGTNFTNLKAEIMNGTSMNSYTRLNGIHK